MLKVEYRELTQDAAEVMNSLVSRELAVQSKDNTWCLLRISPYRTMENAIEGLVVTFVNITKLKLAEEQASHPHEISHES